MSTIDDRLREAAAYIHEEVECVPMPSSVHEHVSTVRRGRRASAVAVLAAAAVVIVIVAVAALGSRSSERKPPKPVAPPPTSVAPVDMSARLLALSDLHAGARWRSVRFTSNLPANRCLPDLTAQSDQRWGALFQSPAGVPGANVQGTNLQEIITVEPVAIAKSQFAAAENAVSQCKNLPISFLGPSDRLNAVPLAMAALGDESSAYVVTLVSGASADHAKTTIRIGVVLIRVGNVRIDVLRYGSDVEPQQLQGFAQKAVNKVDPKGKATQYFVCANGHLIPMTPNQAGATTTTGAAGSC